MCVSHAFSLRYDDRMIFVHFGNAYFTHEKLIFGMSRENHMNNARTPQEHQWQVFLYVLHAFNVRFIQNMKNEV